MGVFQHRSGHPDCQSLWVARCEKVAKLSARFGQLGGVRRQDPLAMCATNKRSEGRSRIVGLERTERRSARPAAHVAGGEAQNRQICLLLPTSAHADDSASSERMLIRDGAWLY